MNKNLSEDIRPLQNELYINNITIGVNTIKNINKKNLYNAFITVFDNWNNQLENESELSKRAEISTNIVILLDRLIFLANQDSKDIERSLKGETDIDAIVKILGLLKNE